jgi:hypothetical protein
MNRTLLWLDDLRDPTDNIWNNWIARQGLNPMNYDITWVKNYDDFTNWIVNNGLPDVVCFDHDLGQDIAIERYTTGGMSKTQAKKLKKLETMSGFDATKWMVNYCMDNDLRLPDWYIQSANPVGAENIKSYLQSFVKSYQ